VLPAEGAQSGMIEGVVVEPAQPITTVISRPDPLLEPLLDALLLLPGGFRRLGVDNRLLVMIQVVHRGRLEIQGVLDQVQGGATVGAPVRRVRGLAFHVPIPLHIPGPQRWDMPDLDTCPHAQQVVNKPRHIVTGQPGRAQPDVNLLGREVGRLNGLERLDVRGESRISDRRGPGSGQLLADVAREVLVIGFPCLGLGVQEDQAPQLGQEVLHRTGQEPRHVVQVHAAALVQGHEQGFLRRGRGRHGLPVLDRPLVEDGGLGGDFGLVVVELQRQQQWQVRVPVERALVGPVIDGAEPPHKPVVRRVELLAGFENPLFGAAAELGAEAVANGVTYRDEAANARPGLAGQIVERTEDCPFADAHHAIVKAVSVGLHVVRRWDGLLECRFGQFDPLRAIDARREFRDRRGERVGKHPAVAF